MRYTRDIKQKSSICPCSQLSSIISLNVTKWSIIECFDLKANWLSVSLFLPSTYTIYLLLHDNVIQIRNNFVDGDWVGYLILSSYILFSILTTSNSWVNQLSKPCLTTCFSSHCPIISKWPCPVYCVCERERCFSFSFCFWGGDNPHLMAGSMIAITHWRVHGLVHFCWEEWRENNFVFFFVFCVCLCVCVCVWEEGDKIGVYP